MAKYFTRCHEAKINYRYGHLLFYVSILFVCYFYVSMFSLPHFPITDFFIRKSNRANFAWACLITLSNRCYKIFFWKGLIFLENGKTRFFCFLKVGDTASILKRCYSFCIEATWPTIFNCCTMCGTEQPQLGNRDSNPVADNQFLIFSIGFKCSHFLFSFGNILHFT